MSTEPVYLDALMAKWYNDVGANLPEEEDITFLFQKAEGHTKAPEFKCTHSLAGYAPPPEALPAALFTAGNRYWQLVQGFGGMFGFPWGGSVKFYGNADSGTVRIIFKRYKPLEAEQSAREREGSSHGLRSLLESGKRTISYATTRVKSLGQRNLGKQSSGIQSIGSAITGRKDSVESVESRGPVRDSGHVRQGSTAANSTEA